VDRGEQEVLPATRLQQDDAQLSTKGKPKTHLTSKKVEKVILIKIYY